MIITKQAQFVHFIIQNVTPLDNSDAEFFSLVFLSLVLSQMYFSLSAERIGTISPNGILELPAAAFYNGDSRLNR